jgi:succinate dehydrogenase / fumarate reductase cytochrome b subunit
MESGYTQEAKKVESFNESAGTKTIIVKDLYNVVSFSFQNILLVLFYVLSMFAVAFHMFHGFQSAFQTMGWSHPKYTPLIKGIGVWVFAVLIPIGYAAMPLYFYFFK